MKTLVLIGFMGVGKDNRWQVSFSNVLDTGP